MGDSIYSPPLKKTVSVVPPCKSMSDPCQSFKTLLGISVKPETPIGGTRESFPSGRELICILFSQGALPILDGSPQGKLAASKDNTGPPIFS